MNEPMKVGIVGCAEGTHGKVWAELLASEAGARFGMKPVRVWDRSREAAAALAKAIGAEIAATPADCGHGTDGVLITELLPDRYLELARPFLEQGRRVFLNRPFAGSVADAHAIIRLAARHGARLYSASALYHTQAAEAARAQLAKVRPLHLFNVTGASDHIVFYLPHAIAAMVSVLGTGVASVQAVSLRSNAEDKQRAASPVVVYVEYGAGASVGAARGTVQMIGPRATWYGFTMNMFGANGASDTINFDVTYDRLLATMAEFFRTGVEPISRAVILEKTCIFHAALASARRGSAQVNVARLIEGKGT